MKIRPMGAELFNANRQSDRLTIYDVMKLIFAFSQFCELA